MARPKKKSIEFFAMPCDAFTKRKVDEICRAMNLKYDGGDLVVTYDIEAEDVQEEVGDNGKT